MRFLKKTRKVVSPSETGKTESIVNCKTSLSVNKEEIKEEKSCEQEETRGTVADLSRVRKLSPAIFKSRKLRQKIQKVKDHWGGKSKSFPHLFRIFTFGRDQDSVFEVKDLSKKGMGQSESESQLEEGVSVDSDEFSFRSLAGEEERFELVFEEKHELGVGKLEFV